MPLPSQLEGRLRVPVVAAPMFLVSGPELVIETCKAGALGTLPALNQRTTAGLDEWLTRIDEELGATPGSAPYGVNLIAHRTNPRLQADLEVIVEHEVPLVITSLGAATEVVEAVHSYGGLVFHDVTGVAHARKAAAVGVDGLILVSAGAGGHAGSLNPFALMAEVRPWFEGTILLAGCLSTGRDVLAARAMGADLAYLGTRFIATEESMASDGYREMIVDAAAADIVYTPAISTIPANFLRESIVAAGLDPEHLAEPEKVDLSHVTNPHAEGEGGAVPEKPTSEAKAWRDIWSAGQGSGAIDAVLPARDLVVRLAEEYEAAREQLCGGGTR